MGIASDSARCSKTRRRESDYQVYALSHEVLHEHGDVRNFSLRMRADHVKVVVLGRSREKNDRGTPQGRVQRLQTG